jgi:hypothetical protein
MTINLDDLASDIENAIDDLPGQIKFGEQVISASVSPVTDREDVDEMGALVEADCEAVALRSAFANGVLPNIRTQPIQARMTEADEWQSFHVQEREVDAVSVTLRLRKM